MKIGVEKQRNIRGSITVEYALVIAIVIVGIAEIFAPRRDSKGFGFYDQVRSAYRRTVVVVSAPWL